MTARMHTRGIHDPTHVLTRVMCAFGMRHGLMADASWGLWECMCTCVYMGAQV